MCSGLIQLEDHAGEIIRKARALRNVSLGDAADAGGVSSLELLEFEQTGKCDRPIDFLSLGRLLSLSPKAIQKIAEGWRPEPVDLSPWQAIRMFTSVKYGNVSNSYLVWDEFTKDGGVFDTGWESTSLIDFAHNHQIRIRFIFLTHRHQDHTTGLSEILKAYPGATVYEPKYYGEELSVSYWQNEDETIMVGQLRVQPIPLPGHTGESAIFVVDGWANKAPAVVFSGDSLFCGSIGKGYYSWQMLFDGVKCKIFSLPLDTLICPGHGPLTTVGREMVCNPFFASE